MAALRQPSTGRGLPVVRCQEECLPGEAKPPTMLEGAGKPVHIAIKRQGRSANVRLSGEFDLKAAPQVREQLDGLIDAGLQRIVIDLRQVRFLDSSGLGVLLGRYRRLSERGGSIYLVTEPEGSVRTVLEMSGVRQVMPLLASESEVPRA
jgi:stage II sporulation protein AA (anti-sigma F factor antagonist)